MSLSIIALEFGRGRAAGRHRHGLELAGDVRVDDRLAQRRLELGGDRRRRVGADEEAAPQLGVDPGETGFRHAGHVRQFRRALGAGDGDRLHLAALDHRHGGRPVGDRQQRLALHDAEHHFVAALVRDHVPGMPLLSLSNSVAMMKAGDVAA